MTTDLHHLQALNLVTDTLKLVLTGDLELLLVVAVEVHPGGGRHCNLIGSLVEGGVLCSEGEETGRAVNRRPEVIGATGSLVRGNRGWDASVETRRELHLGAGSAVDDILDETVSSVWSVEGEEGDTVRGLGGITLAVERALLDDSHAFFISIFVSISLLGIRVWGCLVTLGEGHEDEGHRSAFIHIDSWCHVEWGSSHGTAGEGGSRTRADGLWHNLDARHLLFNLVEFVATDVLHVDVAVLVETVREGTLELSDTSGGGNHNATIIDGLEESGTSIDDITIVGNAVGDAVEELVTETDITTHTDTETTVDIILLGTGRVIKELLWPLSIHEVNLGNETELDSVETVVEGDGERVTLIHNLETVEADGVVAKDLLVKRDGDLHDVGIPLPEGGGTLDVSDNDGHVTLRRLSLRGELWVGGTTIEDDITGKLDVEWNADEGLGVSLHAREDG